MTALDAYFGVEEWVYSAPTDQPGRLNGYFGIEELVYASPSDNSGRLNAYFGIEEYTGGVVVLASRSGFVYAYEYTTVPPVANKNGYVYAYEYTTAPPVASKSGYAYAYENTITQAHPGKLYISDGSAWVRLPAWYIWTGTTHQQIL